jgi:hypothetical protein
MQCTVLVLLGWANDHMLLVLVETPVNRSALIQHVLIQHEYMHACFEGTATCWPPPPFPQNTQPLSPLQPHQPVDTGLHHQQCVVWDRLDKQPTFVISAIPIISPSLGWFWLRDAIMNTLVFSFRRPSCSTTQPIITGDSY